MARKLRFKPEITRVKLNPEQAVLQCLCRYGQLPDPTGLGMLTTVGIYICNPEVADPKDYPGYLCDNTREGDKVDSPRNDDPSS